MDGSRMSSPALTAELADAARAVKLVAFDLDGTLTDGRITYDSTGREFLSFNTHDDVGVKYLLRAGLDCAVVSGRDSPVAVHQAELLGIPHVELGAKLKQPVVDRLLERLNLDYEALCFVGDDIPDLPVVRKAGLGVAVSNAHPALKREARMVTSAPGGCGAVREIVEFSLKAQDLWTGIMERYRP